MISSDQKEDQMIRENKLSEVDLLVEMERRGMKIPTDETEKMNMINTEHMLGHFGREAIFKAIYNKQVYMVAKHATRHTECH